MKPSDVTKKDEKYLLETAYNRIKMADPKQKFRIGDYVRISKVRGVFDKKYLPNWSAEIFQVKKVQLTNPTTYLLKDSNNVDVLGCFYDKQLTTVKHPTAYLVEKIIRKKGDKVYVKQLGFDKKYNSWIKNDNIL